MSKKRLSPEEAAQRARWIEVRSKVHDAVRRFNGLSPLAYRLWSELAFGWSWDDPFCYPNYEVLSTTLGWHRNTVAKFMNELVSEGLVSRKRGSFGYFYTIVTDIPTRYLTSKLNNKAVVGEIRSRKAKRPRDAHDGVDQPAGRDAHDGGHHDAHDGVDHISHDAHDGGHHDAHDGVDAYKQMNLEADELLEEADEREAERPEPASPASSDPQGMTRLTSRFALGYQDTAMADADELIAEGMAEKPLRKRKVKNKASSPALVSVDGRSRTPFPDEQGSSQNALDVPFDLPPPSPPVEAPNDLLLLLRDEVRTKWGPKVRGFEQEVFGKLSGQLTNMVLRKYPPDVILSMVRLLVWDWEVARGVCFPFKRDQHHPTLEDLALYADELAPRVDTGFVYPPERRGASNTYRDLFIKKIPFVRDD